MQIGSRDFTSKYLEGATLITDKFNRKRDGKLVFRTALYQGSQQWTRGPATEVMRYSETLEGAREDFRAMQRDLLEKGWQVKERAA